MIDAPRSDELIETWRGLISSCVACASSAAAKEWCLDITHRRDGLEPGDYRTVLDFDQVMAMAHRLDLQATQEGPHLTLRFSRTHIAVPARRPRPLRPLALKPFHT